MRRVYLAVFLVVFLPYPARADGEAEARKILDRAIVALGGEKVLQSGPALVGRSTGTLAVNENRATLRNEWSVAGHDRLRWNVEGTTNDTTAIATLVLNKDKAWFQLNGSKANPFPKEVVGLLHTTFGALRLLEDPLPLRGKGYSLSPLGELKVEDRLAIGIKVCHKGQPDFDMFFDKETGLPVRGELRVKESADGEEVCYTALLGGYKKVADRQHFTTLTVQREGKVMLEMERTEVKAVATAEEGWFAQP